MNKVEMPVLKFLLIEDNKNNRFILNNLLKKNFKCEVQEAVDGQTGLSLLMNYIPDLILLDLSMPVMDGIKTLEIIRGNQILKNIPVIVITALRDGRVVNNLAAMGICDYILKPIDIKDSLLRIKKIIDIKVAADRENYPKIEEHILILDEDKQFKLFFKSLLSSQYIIHEAANGITGFDIYLRYSPRYVFVSDRLSLLDKKIISQKIKEHTSDTAVSIYLLVDDLSKLSTKVFNYDGIIKREFDGDLFLNNNDFFKNSPPATQAVEK